MRRDNVLLTPIDFSSSDVVMKAPSQEDKPEWGLVVSVGDLVQDIIEGDVVLYMSYGATKVESLGHEFLYVREEDVVTVYNGCNKPKAV